ncbi:transmembrane protein C1orf162 homolog [Oryctolagus cuniculus]|uniref:transmembrane protein C1orf162 homolog n=1 Tax=Oryctolagus cuniculus TaxID=9986 RepID=UPI0038795B02
MGGSWSTPKTSTGRQAMLSTAAPTTSPAACLSKQPSKEYLLLAFFVGILLTLLLLAFVFLIIKSYRKCHSTSQVLDPHSDPPAKVSSTPDESLTYASMTFKISEKKRNHSTEHRSADLEPVVYAQINVADAPCLSREA